MADKNLLGTNALTTEAKAASAHIAVDKSGIKVNPEKAQVNTNGPHRDFMDYYFKMYSSLEGGTQTMREAAEDYLPRFPEEDNDSYLYRLNTSFLFNFHERILDTFSGLIFNEPVSVDSNLPEEILEDVDLEGSGVHEFLEECGYTAMGKGWCVALVDNPPSELDEKGNVKELTKEEVRKRGIRPNWVKIEPENIIDIHYTRVNGVDYITHMRWMEIEQSSVGEWGNEYKEIIKVIRKPKEETSSDSLVYEKWVKEDNSSTWTLEEGPLPYAHPFVTATVIYSTKPKDKLCARPLLAKIAEKNIEYWQTASDQRQILTVSRFSILHLHKVNGSPKSVGPMMTINTEEDEAKVEFVSNENPGISYGEKDKDRIVQEAEALSIELLVKPKETATKTRTNNVQNMSALQRTAKYLEVSGNMLLYYTSLWLGGNDGGSLKVNKDFGITVDEKIRLDDLNTMFATDAIDQRQYLIEKKSLGVLSEAFSINLALEETKGNITIADNEE